SVPGLSGRASAARQRARRTRCRSGRFRQSPDELVELRETKFVQDVAAPGGEQCGPGFGPAARPARSVRTGEWIGQWRSRFAGVERSDVWIGTGRLTPGARRRARDIAGF